MNTISIVLVILSISVCVLLTIVVYNPATRWTAWFITPVLCIAAYLGYSSAEDLKGSATRNVYKDDAVFLGSSVTQKWIYVLIQPVNIDEPILMALPFTETLAKQMTEANQNLCEGKPQGTRGVQGTAAGDPSDQNEQSVKSGVLSLEVYDFTARIGRMK